MRIVLRCTFLLGGVCACAFLLEGGGAHCYLGGDGYIVVLKGAHCYYLWGYALLHAAPPPPPAY